MPDAPQSAKPTAPDAAPTCVLHASTTTVQCDRIQRLLVRRDSSPMLLDCGRTQRQLANHSSEPAPPRSFADQRCPPRPIVLNASVGQHVCSSLLSRTHSAPISTTILPLSSSLLRVIRGAAESEGAPYPFPLEAPQRIHQWQLSSHEQSAAF